MAGRVGATGEGHRGMDRPRVGAMWRLRGLEGLCAFY